MGDRTRLRFRHRLRSLRESVPGKNPIELTHPQDGAFQVKISARNILKGKIVEVTKGQTTAHVRIDIGGAIVTASITNEAVDDLKLASGQSASAVIKASDVMVAID
jgi:molybdopterin-binding protein